MPSIAPAPPSPVLNARKRRRDDVSSSAYTDGSAMSVEMQIEMKLAASPYLARHETSTLFDADKICESLAQRNHLTRPRRDGSKRQRPNGSFDAWKALDDMENGIEYTAKEEHTVPVKDTAKINLSPCHICHRKPSERRELDEYSNCEGCGRRTCYVCIRQCEGEMERRRAYMREDGEREGVFGGQEIFGADDSYDALMVSFHGDEMCIEGERRDGWEIVHAMEHKGKVCSRCCVEKGSEGEVWCLGCLRAEEGD